MRKASYLAILLLSVMAVIATTACVNTGTGNGKEEIVSGTGLVKYINLEGGFYGIITDDGKQYDPVNLSQEYQREGLRISFEAKVRKDVVGTHMWGTPVEIIGVESLEPTRGT